MNAVELHTNYDIHPDIRLLIERVEDETEKPIEFLAVYNLDVDATTRIARAPMPRHTIRFKSTETRRLNHLLAFSCGQILRTFAAPAERRQVPVTTPETLALATRALANDKATLKLPEARVQEILTLWITGLMRQLANVPSDVFLNLWLHQEYPDLRFEQQESLEAEMSRNEQALSPQVQRMSPRLIFNGSNAMNYVYRQALAEITGERNVAAYRLFADVVELGRRLQRVLQEAGDRGLEGDGEIIDRWAKLLRVEGWYMWHPFEEMPPGFDLGVLP